MSENTQKSVENQNIEKNEDSGGIEISDEDINMLLQNEDEL